MLVGIVLCFFSKFRIWFFVWGVLCLVVCVGVWLLIFGIVEGVFLIWWCGIFRVIVLSWWKLKVLMIVFYISR